MSRNMFTHDPDPGDYFESQGNTIAHLEKRIAELEQWKKHWKDKWQKQTFEYIELKTRSDKLEALKQKADELLSEAYFDDDELIQLAKYKEAAKELDNE